MDESVTVGMKGPLSVGLGYTYIIIPLILSDGLVSAHSSKVARL